MQLSGSGLDRDRRHPGPAFYLRRPCGFRLVNPPRLRLAALSTHGSLSGSLVQIGPPPSGALFPWPAP